MNLKKTLLAASLLVATGANATDVKLGPTLNNNNPVNLTDVFEIFDFVVNPVSIYELNDNGKIEVNSEVKDVGRAVVGQFTTNSGSTLTTSQNNDYSSEWTMWVEYELVGEVKSVANAGGIDHIINPSLNEGDLPLSVDFTDGTFKWYVGSYQSPNDFPNEDYVGSGLQVLEANLDRFWTSQVGTLVGVDPITFEPIYEYNDNCGGAPTSNTPGVPTWCNVDFEASIDYSWMTDAYFQDWLSDDAGQINQLRGNMNTADEVRYFVENFLWVEDTYINYQDDNAYNGQDDLSGVSFNAANSQQDDNDSQFSKAYDVWWDFTRDDDGNYDPEAGSNLKLVSALEQNTLSPLDLVPSNPIAFPDPSSGVTVDPFAQANYVPEICEEDGYACRMTQVTFNTKIEKVSEPGSLAMFALGLLGLAGYARKKKQS